MVDIVVAARSYRVRLQAKLAEVDAFLRTAEDLMEGRGLGSLLDGLQSAAATETARQGITPEKASRRMMALAGEDHLDLIIPTGD